MAATIKLANTSVYGKFRVGAIIAQRKAIIAMGTNNKKSHPLQAKFSSRPHLQAWMHAEVHALSLGRAGDLEGADAYVARVLADGSPANSRPCSGCSRALRHFGIKRVFYCSDGKFYKEEL